ncbi:MAG: flagellin [Alphaproteobacteria bacterium]|nr:flagellin [Alphaproteobacteria bacterium]
MADQVGLSGAVRANLLSLQQTSGLAQRTDERLASGLRVRDPFDGASEFFQSRALSDRAQDLTQTKDGVDQALSSIQAATNGLDAIGELASQAEGIAIAARNTNDPTQRAALANQFNELQSQIDSIAQDASFGGTNLIQGSPDDLDVSLNEDGSSSLTIQGADSSSAGLGINNTTFATDADIDAALAETQAALSTVRTNTATLGSSSSALQTRLDFTEDLTNTLEAGAASLTDADLTEEAANRLSLQARQQIGLNATSLAAQSETAILGLFG